MTALPCPGLLSGDGRAVEDVGRGNDDGAISARAMLYLRRYAFWNGSLHGVPRTITSVYHAGELRLMAHSATPSSRDPSKEGTHMHLLWSGCLTESKETFLEGKAAFKNVYDVTTEYRNELVNRSESFGDAKSIAHMDDEEFHVDRQCRIIEIDSIVNASL